MAVKSKPGFLLHCCCAPCSTYPLRILREDFNVTAFFYNPNIHPRKEYIARKEEMESFAARWGVPLIVGEYDVKEWFRRVKGYEDEPEGGARCEICYRMRLEKTVKLAREKGIPFFGTTLTISPHKKAVVINRIGKELGEIWGVNFYEADFKKKDGFKISCQISREEGLYRQDYCGCIFSLRERNRRKRHD